VAVLGFELWILVLTRQVLYNLSHATSPFCYHYFSNRLSLLCLRHPRLWSFYLCFPHNWNDRHVLLCLATGWNGSCKFFWGWPQTMIFHISASWVARITGMNHHAQPITISFDKKTWLKKSLFYLYMLCCNLQLWEVSEIYKIMLS
jgi:hypothetical protein